MREPRSTSPRPTGMLRALFAVSALLLGLCACGDAGSPAEPSSSGSGSPSAALCTMAPNADYAGIASVDLDGDGRPEQPVAVQHGSRCTGALSVEVAGKTVASVIGALPVDPHGLAILVPGRTGQVLVVTQRHPRGGYQTRLYAYADGRLAELTSDGRPLLPFVATDTPKSTTPVTASCTKDGITVTSGRYHQPVGIAFAWDLYRTTYTIHGNDVSASRPVEVARNVLPEQLVSQHTALARHQLFENCVAANPGAVVAQ